MPNITIDYTANLRGMFVPQDLVAALHRGAVACETFPITGIRVFCRESEHFVVAHGERDEGFVQIQVRIAPGRSDVLKRRIAETLLAAAENALEPVFATRSVGLQLEVTEFADAFTVRKSTLKD